MDDSLSIDGFGPLPVARPSSVAELSDLVRRVAADGRAVYPVGGRTMLDYGLPPTKPGTAIDLRGLDQVIDYPARDMTITVQAGIGVAKLQAILRAEGQQLPIDVPLPDRATLGGAVATNASGPRRLGHGTLRDYVIGISIVNDRGEEVKAGGRVVKNVAGYDLMKLFTGSLGTLGIITQLTLKVKPLPEAVTAVLAPGPTPALAQVLTRIVSRTATRPTAVSVANAPAAALLGGELPRDTILIAFEEMSSTVAWQIQQLNRELPDEVEKMASEVSGEEAVALLRRWADFPLATPTGLTFKANLVPAGVADFLRLADALVPRPALVAHAGSGIGYGHFAPEVSFEQFSAALKRLTQFVGEYHGNVVVTRCPATWKAVVPVWGRPTGDRELMRAVKDKMDPGRVFNPGRFVDGI
ncbi:MAG TPA: FAD-binding oxidoreductase [Gemmataceae bacterium]|nr:FAD-binding oxidoreductase [Gemmataceae bacterium]